MVREPYRGLVGELLSLLRAEAGKRPGPRCTIGVMLSRLSPEDRADAETALAEPSVELPSSVIARVLSARTGKTIQAETLARHRARRCACP